MYFTHEQDFTLPTGAYYNPEKIVLFSKNMKTLYRNSYIFFHAILGIEMVYETPSTVRSYGGLQVKAKATKL